MARRSKYDRARPKLIKAISAGATVREACELASLSEGQFYEWQKDKPEFYEAIVRAREGFALNIDEDLVSAFTKRLLTLTTDGHTVTKTTSKYVLDEETGEMKEVSREVEETHYAAPPRWVADKLMPDSLAEKAGPMLAVQINNANAA